MIKEVDNVMNKVACFEAPIVDAVSEIAFAIAGLTGAYGVYLVVTGKAAEGGALVVTGVAGMMTTSYTKEISQTVEKSCRV